jgi:hypothetical protein
MNGIEKSDPAIVAVKPANEPLRRGKEWVEPRAGAKGNAEGPRGVRTQSRAASTMGIDRVGEAARLWLPKASVSNTQGGSRMRNVAPAVMWRSALRAAAKAARRILNAT